MTLRDWPGAENRLAQGVQRWLGVVTMIRMAPTKRPKITAQNVTTTTLASVIQRKAREPPGRRCIAPVAGPAPGV